MKQVTRGIRVWVLLEFDEVNDPDSQEAIDIASRVADATDELADDFKASRCYVTDVTNTIWLEGETS
jgi:hypothetical protein